MSQKLANVEKQIAIEAKQADKSDGPKMKKPFDEITKPIKTTKRIVETPDGEGYQLLSEVEKKKVDRDKKFELMGLLHFSDNEEDELSLETITSDKSKGSNKSQGSQKPIAKPKPKQPIRPKQTNNLMLRTVSQQVKESEMTPFHKDTLSLAGGLATPSVKGSSLGGWTTQGSGKRAPTHANSLPPKPLATCYISAILHHQTLTATLDQQAVTRSTGRQCSKSTRRKKSAMQQLTSCLLKKSLSRFKKALLWCNQIPTKHRTTFK